MCDFQGFSCIYCLTHSSCVHFINNILLLPKALVQDNFYKTQTHTHTQIIFYILLQWNQYTSHTNYIHGKEKVGASIGSVI